MRRLAKLFNEAVGGQMWLCHQRFKMDQESVKNDLHFGRSLRIWSPNILNAYGLESNEIGLWQCSSLSKTPGSPICFFFFTNWNYFFYDDMIQKKWEQFAEGMFFMFLKSYVKILTSEDSVLGVDKQNMKKHCPTWLCTLA